MKDDTRFISMQSIILRDLCRFDSRWGAVGVRGVVVGGGEGAGEGGGGGGGIGIKLMERTCII